MSDFSDEQDHTLIRLVLQEQSASGKIDWKAVSTHFTRLFPGTRKVPPKTRLSLRQRLKTLKRTHGADIHSFPKRFYGQTQGPASQAPILPPSLQGLSFQELLLAPLPTAAQAVDSHHTTTIPPPTALTPTSPVLLKSAQTITSLPVVHSSVDSYQAPASQAPMPTMFTPTSPVVSHSAQPMAVLESFTKTMSIPVAPRRGDIMNNNDVYKAVQDIFETVTRSDVSQPSGEGALNSGEIKPIGVSKMIQVMGVGSIDVFGDIGSGTGSVVAQVALATSARECVGLEIRESLAAQSRRQLDAFSALYARLDRTCILTGDIKHLTQQAREKLLTCTILFCNNMVFNPEDNHAVQDFILSSNKARMVLLSNRFCGRCRGDRCANPFCHVWESEPIIKVEASWRAAPIDIFVYHRRNAASSGSTLLSMVQNIDD